MPDCAKSIALSCMEKTGDKYDDCEGNREQARILL